jgi:hypothetical protein
MEGCGLFGPSEDSQETTQPPKAEQPKPPPAPSPKPPAFAQPTQPSTSPNVPGTVGLIPSTDVAQRKQAIAKGRPDPFAVIPMQPVIKREKTVKPPVPAKKPQLAASKPTPVGKVPTVRPAIPAKKVPPPPPVPTDAKAVVVSGVVQVGNTSFAIVKAPGESVTRNVTVGDTLSNRKVRVKAIYAISEPPTVILEQYGIEVSRAVGEQPEAQPAQSSVSIPVTSSNALVSKPTSQSNFF